MARLAAQANAYYYPTPESESQELVRLIRNDARTTSWYPLVVADPCAGRGELLLPFLQELRRDGVPTASKAVELDRTRYETLKEAVSHEDAVVFWGDARRVSCARSSIGLLLLNPPYDLGREEEAWYHRWVPRLVTGGVLVLIIPIGAVRRVATHLASNFEDVRIARFSDGEFDAFKQVAIIARRCFELATPNHRVLRLLETPPDDLPVLGTTLIEPVSITATGSVNLSWRLQTLDQDFAASHPAPWIHDSRHQTGVPVPGSLGEFPDIDTVVAAISSPTTRVVIPPSPAHMATLLASGMLDGAVLTPDDPDLGLPEIAMRGTYEREWAVVEERFSKQGEKTAEIEQQTPTLSVSVIDLETGRLWKLVQSADQSFDRKRYGRLRENPEDWSQAPEYCGEPLVSPLQTFSTGDLITLYGRSCRRVIGERCVATFDPEVDEEPVPGLSHWPRTPFSAQRVRIQAVLRLIRESGVHPLIQGQTGTGKTTVAAMAAAGWILSHPGTGIQRVLVIAPSHLVPVWLEEQIPDILGTDVEVVDLDSITAVDRWMREDRPFDGRPVDGVRISFGILSRSRSKLGYLVEGIDGVASPAALEGEPGSRTVSSWRRSCPDCGAPMDKKLTKKKRGSRRARCRGVLRPEARDVWAVRCRSLLKALEDSFQGRCRLTRAALDTEIERVLPVLIDAPDGREDCLQSMVLALSSEAARVRGAWALFRRGMDGADLLAPGLRIVMCEAGREDVVEAMRIEAADRGVELPYVYTPYDRKIEGARPGSEPMVARLRESLEDAVRFETRFCNAPHFTASVGRGEGYRRYPLARYVHRLYRGRLRFAVSDEAHEAGNPHSAQSLADQYLYQMGCPVIRMTGTSSNGYPTSMSVGLWYGGGVYREDYGPRDQVAFQNAHGYNRRKVEELDQLGARVEFGSTSNARTRRTTMGSPAPGITPAAVTRYVLPVSVPLALQDLDCDLPPHGEETVLISPLPEQKRQYDEVMSRLREAHIKDRFTERAGVLRGAITHARSCLDRNLVSVGNNFEGGYLVTYPERFDHQVVCHVPGMDSEIVLPKERALQDICITNRESGGRTLVGVWYTGPGRDESLPVRLARHLERSGLSVAWLDPHKVPPRKRLHWIQRIVVDRGCDVLITQPRAVETGLNNLVYFDTGVLFDGTGSLPTTYDQFSGRLHRPGQTRPTRIISLVYEGTAQVVAHEHQMRKVAVIRATDGMDPRTALRSVGADGGAVDYSMSLAEMILSTDC